MTTSQDRDYVSPDGRQALSEQGTDMTALRESIARARTLLYVPGHRPDRFGKAAASGADHIVLDLEDAVGPELKTEARHNVHRWLAEGGPGLVRINGVDSPWYKEDVAMLAHHPCAVILPKAASPDQVTALLKRRPDGSCVVAILETAAGILAARRLCSTPGVVRVIFGSADLARELGIDHTDRAALAYARSLVVLASAASGLAPPLDGATTAINDEKVLVGDAEDAAAVGFAGKSCIHPAQVPLVRAAFEPSAEELHWAREVLAAAGDGSAASLDGEFIGKPIVKRASRILHGSIPISHVP